MKKILIHILEVSLGILFIVLIVGCLKYRSEIWDYINPNKVVNTSNEVKNEENTDNSLNEPNAIEKEKVEAVAEEEVVPEVLPEVQEQEKIKKTSLFFAGDVLLTGYLLSQYDQKGIEGIISSEILEEMKQADVAIVNQEFPFSNRGEAAKDKQFTFRISPTRVNVLKELGIDMVTLANNHVLDYGREALVDTFDTLNNAQIQYVGAGNNLEEAKKAQIIEKDEKKIGILAASRVIPVPDWAAGSQPGVFTTYDPSKLIEEIKNTKQNCDIVIVYVHWGIEREEYPQDYQRELAKKYIDAGADIIIGAHPHVLQGIEYYNGKPIIYSLGNYIFGSKIPKTVYLAVDIDEVNNISLKVVACATNDSYVLEKVSNPDTIYQYLTEISTNAIVDLEGNIKEKE